MNSPATISLKYALLFIFTFHLATIKSQSISDSLKFATLERLEGNIVRKDSLLATHLQLEVIKQQAIKSGDDVMFARSLYDLMELRDRRTEDSVYFRNSAFIDSLLQRSTSPLLKVALHVMRAQRLNKFDTRTRKFNRATYYTNDLIYNYAALSVNQRDSIVASDLRKALSYHTPKNATNQMLWLSSNPTVFLFEPQLEDIILSEQVNLLALKTYFTYQKKKEIGTWLLLPSAEFRKKLDSLSTSENSVNILTGYYHWLEFNKANPDVAAYIESLAMKYIYLYAPEDSRVKQAYTDYLLRATESSYPPLKLHAVYQLCLIWNKEGNEYAGFNRYGGDAYPVFKAEYQYYPAKALQLVNKHSELLSKYPQFKRLLSQMVKQIRSAGVLVEMKDQQLPLQPIALKVIYKNTDTLFYRIIRVGLTEPREKDSVKILRLVNTQPFIQGKFHLPLPPDYNKHAVFLKLDPLPVGHYQIVFSHKPINRDNDDLHHLAFDITGIVAIHSDEKIFILDRKTGFPLTGAKIKAFKKKVPVNISHTIDDKGYIKIPERMADSIQIVYKADTTGYQFFTNKPELRDGYDSYEIYDKDQYDNLNEFYHDNIRMEIFTDRSIYRPGQTVYFKIIFFTNDPKTGKTILFNRQNLGGLFKSRVKKWLDEEENLLELTDPFNKTVDSVRFIVNEFGTFSGSFTLPKSAATGSWSIEGYPDTEYYNEGAFKVEEYKRPSIEFTMEKQKKILLPGELFDIKLKLNSFSGANLSHIPVSYTIIRKGSIPYADKMNTDINYGTQLLIDKKEYTDEKGELIISVNDTAFAKVNLNDSIMYDYTYEVKATAIDATGEREELDERIQISTHPVKIQLSVSSKYDRQALPAWSITTSTDFEGVGGRPLHIKLYKINYQKIPNINFNVDQWYYTKTEWNSWFSDETSYSKSETNRVLVMDTVINTAAYEKLVLTREKMSTGFYELFVSCKVNGRIIGRSNYAFEIFDTKATDIPDEDINYLPFNLAKPGDKITGYHSAKNDRYVIYQILYVTGEEKKRIRNEYRTIIEKAGIHAWEYQIPADASGQVSIHRITVLNNKITEQSHTIYIQKESEEQPEIIIEKYRKAMAPGEKETFALSVKTKSAHVAAELMTTLYDASLDKLEEHRWHLPNRHQGAPNLYAHWNNSISRIQKSGNPIEYSQPVSLPEIQTGIHANYYLNALQGKALGVNITHANGLEEVMVTAYGYSALSSKTMSNVVIRGITSFQDYNQPLVIVDGVPYTGDLNKINPAGITEAMILKGADATALYGARAAQGVLIISTKGPITIPKTEEPVVKVRKNFNETAFFFPQVHADREGYYRFSFTIPETTTKWNWKILGHTKSARFMYLERQLQTQLNLMVHPNIPRLLYQGDKIKLQSRVSNLDTAAIEGNVKCRIEDAETGQDITLQLTDGKEQVFKLNRKSSGTVSFLLNVPVQQLNPLKIVITAISSGAADAEEHIIPVLSPRVFTRQSIPVQFDKQQTLTVSPITLPADASLYGMGISIAQKAQASLINSLPWLANYSYDCAEQVFNKLRANATALRLMQKDTAAQQAFKNAAAFIDQNKTKEEQLPDELAEEAMPWMNIANRTEHQQKQLLRLLDTSLTKVSIEKHLQRLFSLQRADGGLSWFDGGGSNTYISAYVLSGFGQLKQQGWVPVKAISSKYEDFIERLLKFLETEFLSSSLKTPDNYKLYAMSYWIKDIDTAAALYKKINAVLQSEMSDLNKRTLEQQALFIINAFRYTSQGLINQKAHSQLKNIIELAIYDEQNGIRWKELSDAENLSNAAEETVALLAEAFELSRNYEEIPSYMLKWLLAKRQDEEWRTTKGVAAAITILQKKQEGSFGTTKAFSLKIGETDLSVSDALLNGVPVSFARVKQLPQSLTLQQQGEGASGAFTWYYFTTPSNLDTLNKSIRISKQFYTRDDKGWTEYNSKLVLKTGDQLRVQLRIETTSRLKFVHISDPRAAAFEYEEKESGYRYGNGFSYYESIKDNGLVLFAEEIPKGIFELSYEVVIEHEGEFTSGPARLQCMYGPSQTAYSGTERIVTNR